VVLARGRLSPRVAVEDATVAEIGQWMSGLFPGPPAVAESAASFPSSPSDSGGTATGARRGA
jgi:hypothetical protein